MRRAPATAALLALLALVACAGTASALADAGTSASASGDAGATSAAALPTPPGGADDAALDAAAAAAADAAATVDATVPDPGAAVGGLPLPDVPVHVGADGLPLGVEVGAGPVGVSDPGAGTAADRSMTQRVSDATGIPEAAVAPTMAALVVAGLASTLAALRSAFGVVRVVRWLPVSLPLLGLFSRIEEDRLLDNPVRARMLEIVRENPGIAVQDLRDRAGVAWGTTVHHLQRLEAHGKVTSLRQGAHRRYFVANTAASAQRAHVAAVLHPTARRIASLVEARPGVDQSTVCRELGLQAPSVSKHLGSLEQQGLVIGTRQGRSRHYQATARLQGALAVLEPMRAEQVVMNPAPVPSYAAPAGMPMSA